MAYNPKDFETPVYEEGVYRPDYEKANLTGRRDPILGGLRDVASDVAASAIDTVVAPIAAYARDAGRASGNRTLELLGQAGQRSVQRGKEALTDLKTEYGRQEAENGGENASWLAKAGSAVVTQAPMIGLAALTGEAAPATYAALAHGQQSQQFEEELNRIPQKELLKNPVYQKFVAQGMTHADALRAMHNAARDDPWAYGPNVAANLIFGGLAARAVNRFGTRGEASAMTDRIIKDYLPDAAEGVGGAFVTGAAQSWGTQSGQLGMGTRQNYSYSEMANEGVDMATTVGPVAMAAALPKLRSPKIDTSKPTVDPATPPVTPPATPPVDPVNDVLKEAAGKAVTPPIGAELKPVAINNLSDGKDNPAGGQRAPSNPAAINNDGTPAKVTLPGMETPPVAPADRAPVDKVPTIAEESAERIANAKARQEADAAAGETEQAAPGYGFTTAKGSTYQVHEDGTTSRDKAARPEHPGARERGPQPRSNFTFYMPLDEVNQKLSIVQAEGGHKTEVAPIPNDPAGRWGVRYAEGPDKGAFLRDRVFTPNNTPAKGLIPVEVWTGKGIHFGNEITEVRGAPAVKKAGAPVSPASKFTLEQLKARAANVALSPDYGTLTKHFAEWEKANGTKLGAERNGIVEINTKARAAEKKRIADKAASDKADVKLIADAKADEAASAGLQAKLDKRSATHTAEANKKAAALAREQVAALKAKAEGKGKAEAPKPEVEAKTPEAKTPEAKTPEAKTPEAKTPDADAGGGLVSEWAAKLRTNVTPEVTPEGTAAAAPKPPRKTAAATVKEVVKKVKEGVKNRATAVRRAANTQKTRKEKYADRNSMAKEMVDEAHAVPEGEVGKHEEHGFIVNDLKREANDPGVVAAVTALRDDAKALFDRYKAALDAKNDPTYTIAKWGKKSRASKQGEYYAYMSDLNNFVLRVDKALEKGRAADARDWAIKHLNDSSLVRTGEMATLVENRQARNDAFTVDKKSRAAPEGVSSRAKDAGEAAKMTESEKKAAEEEAKQAALAQKAADDHEARQKSTDEAEQDKADAMADKLNAVLKAIIQSKNEKALEQWKSLPRAEQERRAEDFAARKAAEAHEKTLMPEQREEWKKLSREQQEDLALALEKVRPAYPGDTVDPKHQYTTGKPDPLDPQRVDELKFGLDRAARDMAGTRILYTEISDVFRDLGAPVIHKTAGEVLAPFRPTNKILRPIFDAVYDLTKDMPVEIWSHDMMEAFYKHRSEATGKDNPAPLGYYTTATGTIILRSDAMSPLVVFHEILHAATSRAMEGSERLTAMVRALQDILERQLRTDVNITSELPYQRMIRNDRGKFIDEHEFISELFTRPESLDILLDAQLTKADVEHLNALGYRVDRGENIFKTPKTLKNLKPLWKEFLKAIGFKAKTPNALKVSVDMLQDMFEREMYLRQTDEALGRKAGQIMNVEEERNLYAADPVGGPALVKAWQAGDFPEVVNHAMALNEQGKLGGKAGDTVIRMLDHVNDSEWGGEHAVHGMAPTPPGNPAQVRKGVSNFLDQKFGDTARDTKFQLDNKFRTPLRKLFSSMQYTNDIGNTLETAFRNVIHPIKEAWARREHHAAEYMDTSGANKLLDDIATLKHAIKDRTLWSDFERLLISESYSQAYADQPLGVGLNEHVKAGERRWRQTESDYAKNVALYDDIKARSPDLIAMRNRIFEFSRKELEQRLHHQAKDMLLRENVVAHGDEAGLDALAKHIRRQDKSMTPADRAAMDRIVGTDASAKKYTDFVKRREDIRKVLDTMEKKGPHVPFMRHGKHAVFVEYDIRPDAGVKYNEVSPEKSGDLNKIYDIANEKDADDFIDKVLGHKDVQVTLRNAFEVIYDKSTGERARTWTVEHPDGKANTYTSEAEARQNMDGNDKIRSHDTTAKEIADMKADGQPTDQFETRHRIIFNPTEFVRFDSERDASDFRERANRDHALPNVTTKVTNVETPKTLVSRANVAYTSAELQQWMDRIEASTAYQQLTDHQKDEMKRELRVESARVTMTAGRRTMHLPREYAKGASTDILRNMIDFAGSNARAISELKYRDQIDKAVAAADAYVDKYRDQSGFDARRLTGETDAAYKARVAQGDNSPRRIGETNAEYRARSEQARTLKGHRARDEAMRELKQRLYAPIRVEDSWAIAVKRALQVSMIGHLADTGYLIVNALEPWVFGASVTAGRHGLIPAYQELASATKLVDPMALAKEAGQDIAAAYRGQFRSSQQEKLLLGAVTGKGNTRGDGANLSLMLQRLFKRGLVARDVGTEIERIHDPSANMVFRGLDRFDAGFRAINTGIETTNRASMAVANYRLEYKRAIKDKLSPEKAHEQAVRYAEDSVFKGAGDYGAWNNPRVFNNQFAKLGLQFKKYPLRIMSVYAEALMKSFQGDREAQKQIAYMLTMQAIAAGSLGLPLASFGAGAVNAAYLLGFSDDNYDDVVWEARQKLVDTIGVDGADLVLKGALRFSGADFNAKMSQGSVFFQGSPESRNPKALIGTLGMTMLGAPFGSVAKAIGGFQKIGEAAGHYAAGADTKAMQSGIEGVAGLMQIKQITDIVKGYGIATGSRTSGLPRGQEGSTGQALTQAVLGLTPTGISNQYEARNTVNREKRKDSEWRKKWTDRYVDAPSRSEKSAIWGQVQKDNKNVLPGLRIKFEDLHKAEQRLKKEQQHDESKIGVRLSGRQKAFADRLGYFDVGA